MVYSFTCYGHENVISKHKTTLEFTKDVDLSLKGDCIVGVKADFQLNKIKEFIKTVGNNKKITIIIKTINNDSMKINTMKKNYNKEINKNKIINNENNDTIKNKKDSNNKIIEKINAEINPGFNSDKEMVIRKSDFVSERTFAVNADKAAFELNNDLIEFLKEKGNRITIIIEKQRV
tara:strand:- start:186 stop:716 length:531 start_codon:yes stop_codon:yes gene_type:complete